MLLTESDLGRWPFRPPVPTSLLPQRGISTSSLVGNTRHISSQIAWPCSMLLGRMNIVVAIETDMSDVLNFHRTCLCTAVSLRCGAVVEGRLHFVPRAPLHLCAHIISESRLSATSSFMCVVFTDGQDMIRLVSLGC